MELQGEKGFCKNGLCSKNITNVSQSNFKTVFHYLTGFLLIVQLTLT